MTQGPWTLFDWSLKKLEDGTLDIDTQTVKAVLTGNSQTLSGSFVGTSSDARYSDLTNELSTANGYTAGGVSLTGTTFSRPSSNITQWTCNAFSWTLTGNIVIKYCVLYVDGATNKDLLCFADFDTTSSSSTLTIAPPSLTYNPGGSGIIQWTRT